MTETTTLPPFDEIASKLAGVKCPNCGQEIGIELSTQAMDSSRMSFCIEPHEGEFISAETAGGTLTNLSKMLKAVSREFGAKCNVLLSGMHCDAGKLHFDLLVTRVDPGVKQRADNRKTTS